MDFLDPKKERRNRITLLVGYCMVTLAIAIATLVLLYQSFGYDVNKAGEITQNGLVFVSSQPTGSAIYLNDKRYKDNTNTRVTVPAADYVLRVSQAGYRDWQRPITVNGGDVQHFDYPFLFPQKLTTSTLAEYTTTPDATTQSADKRWIVLPSVATAGSFTEYDLKDPKKPVRTTVQLPDGSFTPGDNNAWKLVEWAADNKHVLLLHTYSVASVTSHEYVLLDRDSPVDSVDLTTALNLNQNQAVSLFNNRTDQFYVYNQADQTLERINGSDGSVVSKLENIVAFKTYGSDYILYVTDKPPTGKQSSGTVTAVLQAGQQTVTLRTLPADAASYPLNLAQYDGNWYVAVAAANDTAAYVYKNPQDQNLTDVDSFPAAWRRLSVANPSFVSFSSNTQFLLVENGQNFITYDFESNEQYRYTTQEPIDQPQEHAAWMDGDRLLYVSDGKLVAFDYDYRNRQTLQAAHPAYQPFFASDFSYAYTIKAADDDSSKVVLTSTPYLLKK